MVMVMMMLMRSELLFLFALLLLQLLTMKWREWLREAAQKRTYLEVGLTGA